MIKKQELGDTLRTSDDLKKLQLSRDSIIIKICDFIFLKKDLLCILRHPARFLSS
jgi:hypothetical protein